MFGHNLGLHVIRFPSGRWGYVGNVPVSLATAIPATDAAVFGCRAWRAESGALMEWKFPTFDSCEGAVAFAQSNGLAPLVDNVPQVA